jgi:hypothetical protein
MKRLVLTNPVPAGCVFPRESVIIEPPYLRQDKTRPGDIYAMCTSLHRKDSNMDVVVTSALQSSCLIQSTKSTDHVVKKAENEKLRKHTNYLGPTQASATKRFIPLAMNHWGLREVHFNATLKEFASILVTRPGGCSLLRGPFALVMNVALGKILHSWGSALTWIAQRQHPAQILGGGHGLLFR